MHRICSPRYSRSSGIQDLGAGILYLLDTKRPLEDMGGPNRMNYSATEASTSSRRSTTARGFLRCIVRVLAKVRSSRVCEAFAGYINKVEEVTGYSLTQVKLEMTENAQVPAGKHRATTWSREIDNMLTRTRGERHTAQPQERITIFKPPRG